MLTVSLNVTISQEFDALIVVLPGTQYDSLLDARTIDRVRQALVQLVDEMQRTHLVLDLSTIRKFGAAFFGIVVAVAKRLRERGKQLVVCGDHLGMFHLANMHSLFPVSDDLRDALQWCSRSKATCVG